jgi:hypothetical protein
MPGEKIVIYHYFEKNELYRDNLKFFLRCGIASDTDYVFIVSGGCSVDLPIASNIRYVFKPNCGFDFGSYEDVIAAGVPLDGYNVYFFVNCTVRGPFLPSYYTKDWTDPFKCLLSDEVKLVGPTVNILNPSSPVSAEFTRIYGIRAPHSHVQSMMFALDRECFAYLLESGFFSRGSAADLVNTIVHYELLMSQMVLKRGWNISCLLPEYSKLDYRSLNHDINPTSADGDPCVLQGYFGRSIHPYEVIFFKANRGIMDPLSLESLSETHLRLGKEDDRLSSTAEHVLRGIPSDWVTYKAFALWLNARWRPGTVVDLCTDGYSALCFALTGAGAVYAVCSSADGGAAQANGAYADLVRARSELGIENLSPSVENAMKAANRWILPIDVLHFGVELPTGTLEASYAEWSPHVKAQGIILVGNIFSSEGARELYMNAKLPKVALSGGRGLGVLSQDANVIREVSSVFESLVAPGSMYLP